MNKTTGLVKLTLDRNLNNKWLRFQKAFMIAELTEYIHRIFVKHTEKYSYKIDPHPKALLSAHSFTSITSD
jgi:hypothetical protein